MRYLGLGVTPREEILFPRETLTGTFVYYIDSDDEKVVIATIIDQFCKAVGVSREEVEFRFVTKSSHLGARIFVIQVDVQTAPEGHSLHPAEWFLRRPFDRVLMHTLLGGETVID